MKSLDLRKEKVRLHFKCFFREWVARLLIVGGRNPAPNRVKNSEMNSLMITLLHKIENNTLVNMRPNGYRVDIYMEDYAMKVWSENRPYADVMVAFYERHPLTLNSGFAYVTPELQFNGAVREKLREVVYPVYKKGGYREEPKFRGTEWSSITPDKVNLDLIKQMIASYDLSLL